MLYPFNVARPTLQRWIKATRPPVPRTLNQYFDSLMSVQWREKYTRRGRVNLMVQNIVAPDDSRIILYTDIAFTESIAPI